MIPKSRNQLEADAEAVRGEIGALVGRLAKCAEDAQAAIRRRAAIGADGDGVVIVAPAAISAVQDQLAELIA